MTEAAGGPGNSSHDPDGVTGGKPFATIIIPCYNEAACIERCLRAHTAQTVHPLELILTDDGSSDGTAEIVERLREEIPGITLLRQEHAGPARARNLAARHARADILVFTDADMLPAPDYVENITRPIRTGAARGTFTYDEFVRNVGNYWADAWAVASGKPVGRFSIPGRPHSVFRAILRTEFERIGGYTDVGTGGVGEDQTLAIKLGYKPTEAPGAVYHHDNPATLHEFFASAAWYGKGWYYRRCWFDRLKCLLRRNPPVSFLRHLFRCPPRYLPGLVVYDFAIIWGMLRSIGREDIAK